MLGVQCNVTYAILHNYAKRDSRLTAYGGIVLQRFEFVKVCMGKQRLCWKSQLFLYFVNKIYLTLLPCCILCCLPASQADLTRFRRLIVLWVSTTKRKTRLHTDFRSARRSKRINPPKITPSTQFLRRIAEEMLKLHVSSLATQFRPQRFRYDTFISRFLRSQLQKQARLWV